MCFLKFVFQNFLGLCASDYYNDCIFHRNIKNFMVQTGDPTNTGKGGKSIWMEPFEDELHSEIRVENIFLRIFNINKTF